MYNLCYVSFSVISIFLLFKWLKTEFRVLRNFVNVRKRSSQLWLINKGSMCLEFATGNGSWTAHRLSRGLWITGFIQGQSHRLVRRIVEQFAFYDLVSSNENLLLSYISWHKRRVKRTLLVKSMKTVDEKKDRQRYESSRNKISFFFWK